MLLELFLLSLDKAYRSCFIFIGINSYIKVLILKREYIQAFVETTKFQYTIIVIIVINAIILGLETSSAIMAAIGPLLKSLDSLILLIFVVEILLRLYARGFGFFKQPWSLFDLAVIVISFIPNGGAFSALRTLRALRILRLISTVPSMRKVVEGLLRAIPGILSVFCIMLLLFYIFAIIGTHLYSRDFPEWFGSIGKSMYSLFQIMTLESWSMGIVRPVMELHPYAWVFFVSYIMITSFTMLNLFIAVIVTAMDISDNETAEESRQSLKEQLSNKIDKLEERLLTEIKAQNKK